MLRPGDGVPRAAATAGSTGAARCGVAVGGSLHYASFYPEDSIPHSAGLAKAGAGQEPRRSQDQPGLARRQTEASSGLSLDHQPALPCSQLLPARIGSHLADARGSGLDWATALDGLQQLQQRVVQDHWTVAPSLSPGSLCPSLPPPRAS